MSLLTTREKLRWWVSRRTVGGPSSRRRRAASGGSGRLDPANSLHDAWAGEERHDHPDGVGTAPDEVAGARVGHETELRDDRQHGRPRLAAHLRAVVEHPAHRRHADARRAGDIPDRCHARGLTNPHEESSSLTAMIPYPRSPWKRFHSVEWRRRIGAGVDTPVRRRSAGNEAHWSSQPLRTPPRRA